MSIISDAFPKKDIATREGQQRIAEAILQFGSNVSSSANAARAEEAAVNAASYAYNTRLYMERAEAAAQQALDAMGTTVSVTPEGYAAMVQSWVKTEEVLYGCVLWNKNTNYAVGNQVKTKLLPSQYVLVCTTAGTSGSTEPDYTGVSVGDSVSDGSVTWMVADDFNTATKTYNATSVLTADNYGRTIKSGTFTVVGGHLVLVNIVVTLENTADAQWVSGRFAYIDSTYPSLYPKVTVPLLASYYNGLFPFITSTGNLGIKNGYTTSVPSHDETITGMYWI